MELFCIIVFCFLLPLLVLVKPIKDCVKNNKSLFKDYKEEVILFFILIVGSLVRLVAIGKFPNALNVDEASSGYDAFSLMKYGVDRGGNSYPVYLYAWGSGQSVLYSYLMIPVLMITGLCEYGIRLPMAIIGIISLYVFYYLIKNIFDNKRMALISVGFFAICPWHIMKSRWGMECNIFPDIILLSTLLFVLGLKKKKTSLQILAFIGFAISSYSYGTGYLFLPVYILGMLGYLIYKKEITIKKSIIYLLIMFVICIPIILYIAINTFGLNQISIGKVTIPKLLVNRYDEVSTVFSGNIIENCVDNLLATLRILILQNDGLEWNAISQFGMFYIISIIFFVIGVKESLGKYKDNIYNQIMNIWMLAAIVLSAFCDANINRINIIMIPCIYYIVVGIYEFLNKYKVATLCLGTIYIVLFAEFMYVYTSKDYNEYYTFTSGVEGVVDYCNSLDEDTVYCQYSFKEPFIYFMFYGETDVHEYLDTVQHYEESRTFDNIKSFGKYKFYLPSEIKENSVIIVQKDTEKYYDEVCKNKVTINQFDIYEF